MIDYLVKPVSLERFVKACNKAWELHQLKSKPKETTDSRLADYIFVNADYSLLKVVMDDIMWVEGLKDYIKIHLKSSPKADHHKNDHEGDGRHVASFQVYPDSQIVYCRL